MRALWALILTACLITATLLAAAAIDHRDPGREILAPNDGWASLSTGTTGGANAADNQEYTVHIRQELLHTLNKGFYPSPSSTPSTFISIIYVDGTIDANVDDNDQPLACA